MDGVDVSLIQSDGDKIKNPNQNFYLPYPKEFQQKLREIIFTKVSAVKIKEVEIKLTQLHFQAIEGLLKKYNLLKNDINLIGFHGHTVIHDPKKKISWQIGDAKYLSYLMGGVEVISNFRQNDIIHGGQGAPLAHFYHFYLFRDNPKPIAIINIGGVANLTYIGDDNIKTIISCDFCFGNAVIDDLVREKMNIGFDKDGEVAAKGQINFDLADNFLENEFFHQKLPKSLDRNQFYQFLEQLKNLKIEDACATSCYVIGKSLAILLKNIDSQVKEIIVCGGGRDNCEILNQVSKQTGLKVLRIEEKGFNGDFIESEAFAFLAMKNQVTPITLNK